jgi:medium-chain acyl-[acyl-carrier-protein] hydrolase
MAGEFVRYAPRPGAAVRLVCFPCAGGGPSMFRQLAGLVPEYVEVLAACLPGREGRRREPPATNLLALAAQFTAALAQVPPPYLVFGHSMGAMVAYEVCRWAERTGRAPLPIALTVSACVSPDRPRDTNVIGQSDEVLSGRLASLGGIPPAAASDPDLMRLVLPITRADLEMVEVYQPRLGAPLPVPLTAIRGVDDHVARAEHMAGWSTFGTPVSEHARPGGHFWLLDEANRDWLIRRFAIQALRLTRPAA